MSAGVVHTREVTAADAALLFAWANDPVTRAASLQTAPISWETHVAWLARKLADARCLFLVALDVAANDEPAGLVRFEPVGEEGERLRVSVVVAPDARGRGLAAPAIAAGVAALRARGRTEPIVAEIRSTNARSIAAFTRCGFEHDHSVPADDGGEIGVYLRR